MKLDLNFKNPKWNKVYGAACIAAVALGFVLSKVYHHINGKSLEHMSVVHKSARNWINYQREHCTPQGLNEYRCGAAQLHYDVDTRVEDCAFSLSKCEGVEPLIPPVPK